MLYRGSGGKRSSRCHWALVPAARLRGTGRKFLRARSVATWEYLPWPTGTSAGPARGWELDCPAQTAAQRGSPRFRRTGRPGRLLLLSGGGGRLFLGERSLERQPDAPLLAIDTDDRYLDLLS